FRRGLGMAHDVRACRGLRDRRHRDRDHRLLDVQERDEQDEPRAGRSRTNPAIPEGRQTMAYEQDYRSDPLSGSSAGGATGARGADTSSTYRGAEFQSERDDAE